MTANYQRQAPSQAGWVKHILGIVNLRPEESQRTLLMFAAYTAFSSGILWLEMSSSALFLEEYGARALPWILIASAGMGFGLNGLYSWMQRIMPLRWVIVVMAVLMAVPILLFRIGLALPALSLITVFIMRLWMEAIFILNELNIAVTANQIFNIREIKRTFPLISSGNLVSDVLSGFSLPVVLALIGLKNVLVLIFGVMMIGAGILLYLSYSYRRAFPDRPRRRRADTTLTPPATRSAAPRNRDREPALLPQLRGPIGEYVILLFGFFILSQIIYLLVDFQYLTQLALNLDANKIAGFLGLFAGILGLVELLTQWFLSSRAIETKGVFFSISLLPVLLPVIALLPLTNITGMLVGGVGLKFIDELLRYTLLSSTTPILFQPVPNQLQSRIQSIVRGFAEPFSMAGVGVMILLLIAWLDRLAETPAASQILQNYMFLLVTIVVSVTWLLIVARLRPKFFKLLVLCADRGELSASDSNLPALRQALVDELTQSQQDDDRAGYIDLLQSVGAEEACGILTPMLRSFSPPLQRKSLRVMLEHPQPEPAKVVRELVQAQTEPTVLALAMRYIWLADPNPNVQSLHQYLDPAIDPIVRGTAAALMLKRGQPAEQALARQTLRQMLVHDQPQERAMGCQALSEVGSLEPEFRALIPQLLQDPTLLVRQAVLETIAMTRCDDYYASLLRGLHYKSTAETAIHALSRLGDPAIPLLTQLAANPHKSDVVRTNALTAISRMTTPAARDALVLPLSTTWGASRRMLLRVLLRMPADQGIEAVFDRVGRRGVELMLNQELMFMGQMLAGILDIQRAQLTGEAAELLMRSLFDLQNDSIDRLFLMMRFLYDADAMQAAEFSIRRSGSSDSVARGLEILDGTLDVPNKLAIIAVLEPRSDADRLHSLANIAPYTPLAANDRLRYLLDLRHFLSDWAIACCFNLAQAQRWSVTADHVLACLRHPTGFVREAVLFYLQVASPRTLAEVLPALRQDPDPLVAAQVQALAAQLSV